MKAPFLLLLLVTLAYAKELKIHVNDEVIEDVIHELKDFGQDYFSKTGAER